MSGFLCTVVIVVLIVVSVAITIITTYEIFLTILLSGEPYKNIVKITSHSTSMALYLLESHTRGPSDLLWTFDVWESTRLQEDLQEIVLALWKLGRTWILNKACCRTHNSPILFLYANLCLSST